MASPATPSTSSPTSHTISGNRLYSCESLSTIISALNCPKCNTPSVKLEEMPITTGTIGFHARLKAVCSDCDADIVEVSTSGVIDGSHRLSTNNVLAVASARNCGFGHEKLVRFFAGLDVPQPMHLRSYNRIAYHIHDAALKSQEECYKHAANVVREHYRALDNTISMDAVIDIPVSFDGTWHKRGHTSHFGVGVIVDLSTGLVLDCHVVSNYCKLCSSKEPRSDEWLANHVDVCQKNHDGSASSMEIESARVIFRRSEERYGLRYHRVLCDGDAKTVTALNSVNVYGVKIEKMDCVNHVTKRMYSGIERLKASLRGTPNSISGRGKVTERVMKKLSNYYRLALVQNAPNIDDMVQGVYAGLYHTMSSDDEPLHHNCPKGADSWCFYNKETALAGDGLVTRSRHKDKIQHMLKQEHGSLLFPLYERLTDRNLLQRCAIMKTQNNNECFNAQIWRRCPKTESTSLKTVQTAVAMAVLEFNFGPTGFNNILLKLGITPGSNTTHYTQSSAKKRQTAAKRHASTPVKAQRKHRKLVKAGLADRRKHAEGVTYAAGGFNE